MSVLCERQSQGRRLAETSEPSTETDRSLVFKSRRDLLLSVCLGALGKLLYFFLLISPGEKAGTAAEHGRSKDSPSAHDIASRGMWGRYTEPTFVVCLLQEPFPTHPGHRTRARDILHITRATLFYLISLFPHHTDCLSSASDSTS